MWGEKIALNSARKDWVTVHLLSKHCCAIQSCLPSHHLFSSDNNNNTTICFHFLEQNMLSCMAKKEQILDSQWMRWSVFTSESGTNESAADRPSYHQWGQSRWQPGAGCRASSCRVSLSRLRRMSGTPSAQLIYTRHSAFHTAIMCSSYFWDRKKIVVCLGFTFESSRVRAEGRSWDSRLGDRPEAPSRLRDAGEVAGHRDESHTSSSMSVWQTVSHRPDPHACATAKSASAIHSLDK